MRKGQYLQIGPLCRGPVRRARVERRLLTTSAGPVSATFRLPYLPSVGDNRRTKTETFV